MKKQTPLGYVAEPEELAGPVVFLASDHAQLHHRRDAQRLRWLPDVLRRPRMAQTGRQRVPVALGRAGSTSPQSVAVGDLDLRCPARRASSRWAAASRDFEAQLRQALREPRCGPARAGRLARLDRPPDDLLRPRAEDYAAFKRVRAGVAAGAVSRPRPAVVVGLRLPRDAGRDRGRRGPRCRARCGTSRLSA